jgi:hypothetical protein
LIGREFLLLVAAAALIALPPAWLAIARYLAPFAEHSPLGAGAAGALALALLVVAAATARHALAAMHGAGSSAARIKKAAGKAAFDETLLLDRHQRDIEYERGIGWNRNTILASRLSGRTVAEVRRNDDGTRATNLHADDAGIEAGDGVAAAPSNGQHCITGAGCRRTSRPCGWRGCRRTASRCSAR